MTCWKLPIVVRILICMHSKLSCIRACCIGRFVKFFCLLILRFLAVVISHNSYACFFLVVFKAGSSVARLYLNLAHVTSAFSLRLIHQHSSSRLQHLVHSHINIRHISIFSPSQYHHYRLNHFKIHFTSSPQSYQHQTHQHFLS
jgi:hypothetical protein